MYRSPGFLSFVLRRVTGIALVLYLFTHIWVIGSAVSGAEAFDERLNFFQQPLFKLAEIALLAAVVWHAFDGIRLLIVHYFKLTDQRKSQFYALLVISALVTIAGGVPILLFMLQGG